MLVFCITLLLSSLLLEKVSSAPTPPLPGSSVLAGPNPSSVSAVPKPPQVSAVPKPPSDGSASSSTSMKLTLVESGAVPSPSSSVSSSNPQSSNMPVADALIPKVDSEGTAPDVVELGAHPVSSGGSKGGSSGSKGGSSVPNTGSGGSSGRKKNGSGLGTKANMGLAALAFVGTIAASGAV